MSRDKKRKKRTETIPAASDEVISPATVPASNRLLLLILLFVPLLTAAGLMIWQRWNPAGLPALKVDQPAKEIDERELDPVLQEFLAHVREGTHEKFDKFGPAPTFDDEPISQVEADARCAEYYLRQPNLEIGAVRKGEPDREGRMMATPNRYTLATKVQGSTPRFRVRNEKGAAESLSRLFMIDPDLVVEIRDGKLYGLRPELRRE